MLPSLVKGSVSKGAVALRFSGPISMAGDGPLNPLYLTLLVNGEDTEYSSCAVNSLDNSELIIKLSNPILEIANSITVSYLKPTDASDQGYVVSSAGEKVESITAFKVDALFVTNSLASPLPEAYKDLVLAGSKSINGLGNAQNNSIVGNSGKNILNGGAGEDRLQGGGGNDQYYVDNEKDVIIEFVNEGRDIVFSTVSIELPANIEDLCLIGTSPVNATGNTANNLIKGNQANNMLVGGGGEDRLEGLWGNDVYVIDSAADVIVESGPANDIDAVIASLSYKLGSNLENLTLAGNSAINGAGNKLDNQITGNSANNILDGGEGGVDRLTGLGGADTFRLTSRPSTFTPFTADKITDYSTADGDRIEILARAFRMPIKVPSLSVSPTSEALNTSLRSAAMFVYNNQTGELYWNENGSSSGHGRGGVIAILEPLPGASSAPVLLSANLLLV